MIEIYQDCEYDGESFSSVLPVFWAKGHDLNEGEFRLAVIHYLIDEEGDFPAMSWEDPIEEQWQRNVEVSGGGIEYRRRDDRPGYDDFTGPVDWFPITILDLERQRRGQHKCAVTQCREPWSVGSPAQIRVSPTVGDEAELGGTPGESIYLWLCRKHRKRYPEPCYRVCMVPVGATIMLPAPDPCGWRGFAESNDPGCVRKKGHLGGHGFSDGSGEQD